jgi:hypothetical protein
MISSEEGPKRMLSVGVESRVGLKFWVSFIGIVVNSDSFASGTKADVSSKSICDSEFLKEIFLIRYFCINYDVRSKGH